MGKPMVRNLTKAGFEVVIHSRTPSSVDTLVHEGISVIPAGSPKEVAEQASVVITMLPDSPDVRTVVFGENGILEGIQPGGLLIDMSTIAPATAIEVSEALQAKGASALDAPVSGGDKGAIAGTLSIMIGGAESDVERARPYFEAMGKTIVHVGAAGAGQVVKACNQVVVAINYAAVSEALVLGAKAGVDPNKIVQVLSGGLANSRVMEMRGPTMISHNFAPGFRVDLHRKDLAIALSTGRTEGVPLPVTAVISQLFDALSIGGGGDLDHSALLTVFEGLANFKVGADA
jgi:2-hydroxy-3-oxopropionate reductase